MATVVFFHAHPDDEAIATGGTMCKLAEAGHRVILVTATRGEHGEYPEGFLSDGESLGERRTDELHAAGKVLSVARGEFLGYVDSGMIGTPTNEAPECFWQADVDEAAERLAQLLREEEADVLTVYDDHGGYGHPDHIQVHRVGVRAAELAGTPRVYESTIDRDQVKRFMELAREEGRVELPDVEGVDDVTMGVPGELITTRVDVEDYVDRKRDAMRAHASQIAEESFFLDMTEEMFTTVFGTESYIRRGAPTGTVESSIVDGLD